MKRKNSIELAAWYAILSPAGRRFLYGLALSYYYHPRRVWVHVLQ